MDKNKKARVLILAINSKYVHTLLAPYYLKSNAKSCDIDIVQSNIKADIDHLLTLIEGVEILALPCYIFNINFVAKFAKAVRAKYIEIKIILGGPEVSFDAQKYLDIADFVITGEGEVSFGNLVQDIFENKSEIPRIINGIKTPFEKVESPYTEEYFAQCTGKIAYFEASRGCPFKCSYCMSATSKLQLSQVSKVLAQLEKFKGRDLRVLKFVDRTFNCNKQYANSLLEGILALDLPFAVHFEIAPELIDDKMLQILSGAKIGQFQFEIGFQTCNQSSLEAINRAQDVGASLLAIARLVALEKCHIHTDLIAGLPFEDLKSFKISFDRLFAAGGHQLQLGFLKVLRGSILAENLPEGYRYDNNAPYEISVTPWLSADDLMVLKRAECALEKVFCSGKFAITLRLALKAWTSPFDFFAQFGAEIYGEAGMALSTVFDRLKAFLIKSEFDSVLVNEALKLDYICSSNDKILPKSITYKPNASVKKQKEIMRMMEGNWGVFDVGYDEVLMTAKDRVLIIDYNKRDPISHRFAYKEV